MNQTRRVVVDLSPNFFLCLLSFLINLNPPKEKTRSKKRSHRNSAVAHVPTIISAHLFPRARGRDFGEKRDDIAAGSSARR